MATEPHTYPWSPGESSLQLEGQRSSGTPTCCSANKSKQLAPPTPRDSGLQGLRKGPNALRWGLDRQVHAAQDRPRTALPARQAAPLPTQP